MENFNWITSVVIPYTNLALFLFLLVKIGKDPMLGAITGRKTSFEQQLKEANAAKEEAQAKHKELSEKLSKLSTEVSEIKNKAKSQAEAEAQKIVKDAETLAAHLTKEAQRIADAEVAKAKSVLRDEILKGVKEKVVGKISAELDLEKQKALFNKQLGSMTSLKGDA